MNTVTSPPLRASQPLHWAAPVLASLLLGACATASPPAKVETPAPLQWNAPLPHGGRVSDLTQWWQSLGDPVLVQLIESAQAVSPSIASATARLAQSRTSLTGAQAGNRPTLDASLSAQRGVNSSSPTVGTALQSNLGAAWEIDIFGGNRKAADAAGARLEGAQAQWHEARVSVAAEVATRYMGWHNCNKTLATVRADAASRQESARLSGLTEQAGFTAPATAALARASAAEGNARATQQQAQCDSTLKALVALTAIAEPDLKQKMAAAPVEHAQAAMISVANLPAAVLAQRPDVYAAERDVAAASFDVGSAQAQRYPRLMLNGSIGTLNYTNAAGTTDLGTWSIGPISVSLPILDGGRRVANVEAAQARYTEAAAVYQGKVRQAVREVEDTLLTLASADARMADARSAAAGYAASFNATQARYKAGSASLPELEDARRIALAAQNALLQLELERTTTWVSLYRVLGGGWNATTQPTSAAQ